MGILAKLFNLIGGVSSTSATTACTFWLLDEPEMPRNLIEK